MLFIFTVVFFGILTVFVCPWQSVFGCRDVVMFVFAACKHKNLVLTFSRCVFLVCFLLFLEIKLFSDLAFLLLCFLLCWSGRFLASFARFTNLFLSPFVIQAMDCHCAFLLCCYFRFCCLFGPVAGVAFFSWCPSVIMRAQQCPPVPFRDLPRPLSVSPRSTTLIYILPTHVRALTPYSHAHICL